MRLLAEYPNEVSAHTFADVRLRFPELLEERDLTPYTLYLRAQGRVSLSTAYRLVRLKGRLGRFDARLCETLCDLLHISPAELFELEHRRHNHK